MYATCERFVTVFGTRNFARLAVLAATVFILIGCATHGDVAPPSVDEPHPETQEASVVRLEDGREGFRISEYPQLSEALRRDFDRAVILLNEEAYGQAVELLTKIIEEAPGVTAPYVNIAIAYRRLGQTDQAEEHLNTALALVPGHPVASNEYGLLYRRSGRFAEARVVYETALRHFPDYYPVHRNLGILCDLYLNDPVCAIEHYEIYSQALPEDQQVKIWITDLRARMGRE